MKLVDRHVVGAVCFIGAIVLAAMGKSAGTWGWFVFAGILCL